MKVFKIILFTSLIFIFSFSSIFGFSGSSSNYEVTTNINSISGSSNSSNSMIVGTGDSGTGTFIRFGNDNYNVSHLLTKPQISYLSLTNNSNINVSNLGIPIFMSFLEDMQSVKYKRLDTNKEYELLTYPTSIINQTLFGNYGINKFEFIITNKYGITNRFPLTINVSLKLNSFVGDFDGDGINDSKDTILGNQTNIFTNVEDLDVEINNSNNLARVFNKTLNVSFKNNNNNTLIEFQNNFNSKNLDLTKLIIKEEKIGNKSKFFLSGLNLTNGDRKTMYIDLLGDTQKYNSICIKDAEIFDFSEISDSCNADDETYVASIPSTVGSYSVSYTNSSNSTVKITGLTHSGVSQVCTEKWSYSSWSTCSSGTQTRTATDSNNCGTTNTRESLTQSCTSSSSNSGSTGSSSSSSGSEYVPSSNSNNGKIAIKPSETFQEKYQISIGDDTDLENTFTGTKKIKLQDRNSNIDLVEFNHDFTSNSLNLENIDIQTGINSNKSFIIVKGLNLQNETKSIRLKTNSNTNTVCIKDAIVNSLDEISNTCNENDEYVIPCNNSNSGNYKCTLEGDYYVVSGLKHSAVVELNTIESNNETTQVPQSETNNENKNISDKEIENTANNQSNNNILYYMIGGVVFVSIISIILVIIFKRKTNKNNSFQTNNENSSSNESSYNVTYKNAKKYVKEYKNRFTKEQIIQALRSVDYPEEIIEKVLEEEY